MKQIAENTEVLPGLPGEGPYPEQFTYSGKNTHTEGFVIRFHNRTETWVGNFQRGYTQCEATITHPNGSDMLVIANGILYTVDPDARQLKDVFPRNILGFSLLPLNRVILFDLGGIFFGLGVSGVLWEVMEPLSSFHDIAEEGGVIVGMYKGLNEKAMPFRLDIASGQLHFGGYGA